MQYQAKKLIFLILFLTITCIIPEQESIAFNFVDWLFAPQEQLELQASKLDPEVYRLAMHAYQVAKSKGLSKKSTITIIDYSLPSTVKRLWVIDVKHHQVKYNTYVSHGAGSGKLVPHYFSDRVGSKQSSLGVFLTGKTYLGKHGLSLRLRGLEKGFNSHAFNRAVVMHSAYYATKHFINQAGYLGRSWGCPAISPKLAPGIINRIKGGSLVFAYYPDRNWLSSSEFL